MISSRENILRTVYGENPEYVPLSFTEIQYVGWLAIDAVEQPLLDGPDAFGCRWVHTFEGAINEPGYIMFDDINDWKKYVKFPDLDAIDFKALAEQEQQAAPFDRENKLIVAMEATNSLMRLFSFMGIENSLVALLTDPDACVEFFDAYSDFKVDLVNRIIDAYDPDVCVLGDDVATAKDLFMSPQTYREVIKPSHRKFSDAINARDKVVEFHCCGKCEEILPDFVEIGVKVWQSAQTMNDLAGILDRYKGTLAVNGGWDSSGKVSFLKPEDSADVLREETRRCLTEYKKPGFILWPLFYNDKGWVGSAENDPRTSAVIEEWEKMKWF